MGILRLLQAGDQAARYSEGIEGFLGSGGRLFFSGKKYVTLRRSVLLAEVPQEKDLIGLSRFPDFSSLFHEGMKRVPVQYDTVALLYGRE